MMIEVIPMTIPSVFIADDEALLKCKCKLWFSDNLVSASDLQLLFDPAEHANFSINGLMRSTISSFLYCSKNLSESCPRSGRLIVSRHKSTHSSVLVDRKQCSTQ